MRLSFPLAAVKDQRNKKKKKKKKTKVRGRRSIVKADSRSALTCREIPEEILVEILVRLPADSLMRFKCVSKIWSSLISSRYFTNLFFKFSSSKPERRVFVYTNDCMLFSSSLINLDATESFLQLNHDLTLPGMKKEDDLQFLNVVRGLICFSGKAGIRIINSATRQVLSLPHPRCNIFVVEIINCNYFGYDPVNDEYKVLNLFSYDQVSNGKHARSVTSESQVLVMGAGASWRKTKSSTSPPPPHFPYSQKISINGVLYYVAWYYHDKICVLMSFDLNSEEFNLIEFPVVPHVIRGLMNYQDQVAVIDDSRLKTECILDLWVLEDDAGKSKWSHKVFGFPYHELELSLNIKDIRISGTGRCGEIWLSDIFGNKNKKITLAVYNVEKNRIMRRFVIEPPCPSFWNLYLSEDVDNIMYLEA